MADELTRTRGRVSSLQALMAFATRLVVSTRDRLISSLMADDHLNHIGRLLEASQERVLWSTEWRSALPRD